MAERKETLQHYDFSAGMYSKIGGPQEESMCLENLYPLRGSGPQPLASRPGWQGFTTTGETDGTQTIGSFYSSGGSKWLHFLIRGGEIWSANPGGNYSKVVTTANLTSAALTLAGTVGVPWVEYNGTVVITDGTNAPFTWDGSSGAGGLVKLTNAPTGSILSRYRPTVYGGKVFFIKSDNTIVWSEENAPNTGYEAGGYNNAWSLMQTATDPVYAILGTEEGLYYWRQNSIGLIVGTVTPDFATTSTEDAIATGVGTRHPDSIVRVGKQTFFMSTEGKPHVIANGQVHPIWQPMERALTLNIRLPWYSGRVNNILGDDGATNNEQSWHAGVYNAATGHVMFSYRKSYVNTAVPTYSYFSVFDATTWRYVGEWTQPTAQTFSCFGEGFYGTTTTALRKTVLAGLSSVARACVMVPPGTDIDEVDQIISGTDAFYYRRVVGPPQRWSTKEWFNVDRVNVSGSKPAITTYKLALDLKLRTPELQQDSPAGFLPDSITGTIEEDTATGAGRTIGQTTSFGPEETRGQWVAVDLLAKFTDTNDDEIGGRNLRIFGWDMDVTDVHDEPL